MAGAVSGYSVFVSHPTRPPPPVIPTCRCRCTHQVESVDEDMAEAVRIINSRLPPGAARCGPVGAAGIDR